MAKYEAECASEKAEKGIKIQCKAQFSAANCGNFGS